MLVDVKPTPMERRCALAASNAAKELAIRHNIEAIVGASIED
jgi:hypothetical protein